MEIVYTSHAVLRMRERNIHPRFVEDMILNPDGRIKQSSDKWILYKKFRQRKNNLLAVVIVKKTSLIEVITVMINFEVRK